MRKYYILFFEKLLVSLKELDLTEGRATGIPTIQQKLQENGSPRATIETDEERTYFLIDIPCNLDYIGVPIGKE